MKNKEVAALLYRIADLLDIQGAIFFKTRAYRLAAQTIEVLDEDIEQVVTQHRLQEIPGIGEAIAQKITEYIETGELRFYAKLLQKTPESLLRFLEIPNLGPKRVAALYNELGVTTIDELKEACQAGRVRDLDGFGQVTEMNILRGIQLRMKTSGRALLNVAFEDGNRYLAYMQNCPDIQQVNLAGSLRRMKATIGDIDILASSSKPYQVMEYFIAYDDIQRVLLQGPTKTSVLLQDNIQVDLRVVEPKSYGAALQYFTGSKEHNVAMRSRAIKHHFKLNEYGLFNKDTDDYIAGESEQAVYKHLGLEYIEPELRENRGEIDAAETQELPQLISYNDIKGDIHVHSNYSDGTATIADIAQAAKQRGYSYIGITDHSQSLHVANGLTHERVQKKRTEIDKLNKKIDDITILCGTECDIHPDGTLDYPNKTLKLFDYVYIGIHMRFKMSEKEMTKRIIAGMENDHANVLAHPTGRLIGRRDSYNVNIEHIIEAAHRTHTLLEINAFPDRLDLNDIHTRMAKDQHVHCVIGTDSHYLENLTFMKYGVAVARRGWLEKTDVLNTQSLQHIRKQFDI